MFGMSLARKFARDVEQHVDQTFSIGTRCNAEKHNLIFFGLAKIAIVSVLYLTLPNYLLVLSISN